MEKNIHLTSLSGASKALKGLRVDIAECVKVNKAEREFSGNDTKDVLNIQSIQDMVKEKINILLYIQSHLLKDKHVARICTDAIVSDTSCYASMLKVKRLHIQLILGIDRYVDEQLFLDDDSTIFDLWEKNNFGPETTHRGFPEPIHT